MRSSAPEGDAGESGARAGPSPGAGGRRVLTRRRFLIGVGVAAAGGVAATCSMDDRWDLALSHVAVELPRLPKAFDGFTIAHLSDIHRGPWVSADFVRQAVDRVNAAQPDLVALTGDYITHHRDLMAECAQLLSPLAAPAGRLAVLGNHDHWVDADFMALNLTNLAGFRVLRNQAVLITRGESVLAIAGLDDPVTRSDDLAAALARVPEGTPTILLSHGPDVAYAAADRAVDLVLAGHTHGGQVAVPGIGPLIVNSRYGRRFAAGLRRAKSTWVYTNRGIGMTVVPLRLNCPPEVALLELRTTDRGLRTEDHDGSADHGPEPLP